MDMMRAAYAAMYPDPVSAPAQGRAQRAVPAEAVIPAEGNRLGRQGPVCPERAATADASGLDRPVPELMPVDRGSPATVRTAAAPARAPQPAPGAGAASRPGACRAPPGRRAPPPAPSRRSREVSPWFRY